jgi:cobalt-zinc-cadmium efflux system membrane fusion protein
MDASAQRNIDLQTDSARSRNVIQTIEATGTVGPNETRVAHIRPLAVGRILKVYVQIGDRVRAGQALATYDNIELGELVGQYETAIASSRKAAAEVEVAQRSLERAKGLVTLGAVAQAETERRAAEYANTRASVATQQSEMFRIEEKLHRFGLSEEEIQELRNEKSSHREVSRDTLQAPFSGIVTKYDIAVGETVDTNRELFTVVDLSTVWVQADVYEKDIREIKRNSIARIKVDAYPDRTFEGRITYISDLLDPKTRTVRVRCEVPNPEDLLKLDMFATIAIPSPIGRTAVMIPEAAVQQVNDRPVVFVRKAEDSFEARDVELGITDRPWVEVVKGIKPGERVVTNGSFSLKAILLREQIGGEE